MKPAPKGWPRISTAVYYTDAGRIEHAELTFGDGLVMVATSGVKARTGGNHREPSEVGGANTQNMAIFVDDADAHCARARAAGAKITYEPKTTDYGEGYWADRSYECEDPGGHR